MAQGTPGARSQVVARTDGRLLCWRGSMSLGSWCFTTSSKQACSWSRERHYVILQVCSVQIWPWVMLKIDCSDTNILDHPKRKYRCLHAHSTFLLPTVWDINTQRQGRIDLKSHWWKIIKWFSPYWIPLIFKLIRKYIYKLCIYPILLFS